MAKKRKPSVKQETPPLGDGERDTQVNSPVEAEPAAGTDLGDRPAGGFPIVGIGASAGGLRSLLLRHAHRCRTRHGLCPGAASGPGPREHPHRPLRLPMSRTLQQGRRLGRLRGLWCP